MAHYFNDDLEYVVDDYEFENYNDEFGQNEQQREVGGPDLEEEDEEDMGKQKNDTSASEYRNGKDIQGIPWERLNYSRATYREMRLKQYKNYQNVSRPREDLEKDYKKVEVGSTFYDFQLNTRLVKSTIVHFQLPSVLLTPASH